jgi:hypothetical protein
MRIGFGIKRASIVMCHKEANMLYNRFAQNSILQTLQSTAAYRGTELHYEADSMVKIKPVQVTETQLDEFKTLMFAAKTISARNAYNAKK